ncbi:MAG: DUF92 domain-containing protein [Candidatus Micrarchaeota archaeon]
MTSIWEAGLVLIFLVLFSYASYKKRWLDNEGILIGWILGLSIFLLGDSPAFVTLLVFFAVGEAATHFVKSHKKWHPQRSTVNILGNALAAIVALLLQSPLGFFAAISASLADTMSSEIGCTSSEKPVLITTFKPVETGVDGAVSKKGLLAAVLGSLVIAACALVFGQSWGHILIIIFAGIFGSLLDSLLGATVQKRGWMDNNEVNFFSSAMSALIAVMVLAPIL